jgi:hypothetical protein
VALLSVVGILILVSWVYLLVVHLKRFLIAPVEKRSAANLLVVLFVPCIGGAIVTLWRDKSGTK